MCIRDSIDVNVNIVTTAIYLSSENFQESPLIESHHYHGHVCHSHHLYCHLYDMSDKVTHMSLIGTKGEGNGEDKLQGASIILSPTHPGQVDNQ